LSPPRLPFRHPGSPHHAIEPRDETVAGCAPWIGQGKGNAYRSMMGRREERIFRLNHEIRDLMRDEDLAAEELIMLQHLDDDAQRDVATYDQPMDRADADETSSDVARMESHIAGLKSDREKLERKRDLLFKRLSS
jgi:hypothetical protein